MTCFHVRYLKRKRKDIQDNGELEEEVEEEEEFISKIS